MQINEVQAALKVVGIDIPGYQLRDLLGRFGDVKYVSLAQFTSLYEELHESKMKETKHWKRFTTPGKSSIPGTYQVEGMADHGADGIVHTIRVEEEVAFSHWINSNLTTDKDLKQHLPVQREGGDLYKKIDDGLILWWVLVI